MIGIVAKLAKAAKLAQTAEAAIDVASNKLSPGEDSTGAPDSGLAPEADLPADYQALLDSGIWDARSLLTAPEAEKIIGRPVRGRTLSGRDETLICDYLCRDRASTVIGVHLPSTLPWEHFDSEIPKKEIFQDVGDAAFRGGRQIYVRVSGAVFWIHTSGEVMVDMAIEAAKLVAGRLRDAQGGGEDSQASAGGAAPPA